MKKNPPQDIDREKFLTLLKRIRKEQGLTQVEVAGRLKRHQSFVSKIESGERRLDIIELINVCQVLGITINKFINRLQKELK